jgi:hypothetical protein
VSRITFRRRRRKQPQWRRRWRRRKQPRRRRFRFSRWAVYTNRVYRKRHYWWDGLL